METVTSFTLLSPANLKGLQLKNRVVMAPMTRSRAIGNIPNEIMTTYYAQRAGAGLIITEGVAPSPNGLGYARIPGIFSSEQIKEWKKVTEAVHEKDAKIFMQLMHTGRVAHPINMPEGTQVVAPSAIAAKGDMWTDTQGMQPQPVPHAMTTEEVQATIQEFVQASRNAIEAGFDGIELHAANGYLIEQFINGVTNQRTDQYGGSVENRSRFLLEVSQEVVNAIGKDKVGLRISPFNGFNDMPAYDEVTATYDYISNELNKLDILYIHTVNFGALNAPEGVNLLKMLRENFKNVLIQNGGFDKARAEETVNSGSADLIAFGVPFIANPDLVNRLKEDLPLSAPDQDLFYTPGEKGYIDYEYYKK